jgi:hypothetical protein
MYRPGRFRKTRRSIDSRYRPGHGGRPAGTVGGGLGRPAAGGTWERSGERPLGGTWVRSGKVPLKVPLIPGPKLRLISSTPLEPPFVLSSDILKIGTLYQDTNSFFIFTIFINVVYRDIDVT